MRHVFFFHLLLPSGPQRVTTSHPLPRETPLGSPKMLAAATRNKHTVFFPRHGTARMNPRRETHDMEAVRARGDVDERARVVGRDNKGERLLKVKPSWRYRRCKSKTEETKTKRNGTERNGSFSANRYNFHWNCTL